MSRYEGIEEAHAVEFCDNLKNNMVEAIRRGNNVAIETDTKIEPVDDVGRHGEPPIDYILRAWSVKVIVKEK